MTWKDLHPGARLCLDGEPEGGVPLYALLGKAGREGVQTLPDWLLRGLTGNGPTPEELLAALMAHSGPVILSGYDNELYNDTLIGWDKLQMDARCEGGGARTETLWVNFETQMTLF